MNDLADFLFARYAEDEAAARAMPPVDFAWYHERGVAHSHLLRWDPRRVLAECEAKRRIIDLHGADGDYFGEQGVCVACERRPHPCDTLRALALPYADHPDYREEWRP